MDLKNEPTYVYLWTYTQFQVKDLEYFRGGVYLLVGVSISWLVCLSPDWCVYLLVGVSISWLVCLYLLVGWCVCIPWLGCLSVLVGWGVCLSWLVGVSVCPVDAGF